MDRKSSLRAYVRTKEDQAEVNLEAKGEEELELLSDPLALANTGILLTTNKRGDGTGASHLFRLPAVPFLSRIVHCPLCVRTQLQARWCSACASCLSTASGALPRDTPWLESLAATCSSAMSVRTCLFPPPPSSLAQVYLCSPFLCYPLPAGQPHTIDVPSETLLTILYLPDAVLQTIWLRLVPSITNTRIPRTRPNPSTRGWLRVLVP